MATDGKRQPIASPCVLICLLNDADICVGCYRSAAEIGDWTQLDDDARRAVLSRACQRSRYHNPFA